MIVFIFIFFSLIFILSIGSLVVITKRCFELMEKIDEIEENLEEVALILDKQHQKIDAKSKIEVFSDEPIVRELVKDIMESRDIVRLSAEFIRDSSVSIKEAKEEANEKIIQ